MFLAHSLTIQVNEARNVPAIILPNRAEPLFPLLKVKRSRCVEIKKLDRNSLKQ